MPIGMLAQPGAVLIAARSPRIARTAAYEEFFSLVASHLASALSHTRAYEEARQRAEALAELDQAKTAFFGNVSHEFRTPLTLLLGPSEDLLTDREDPLSTGQRLRQEMIHRNALRLHRLVDTLLEFSRIEAGRVQAAYQSADVPAFTAELVGSFRSAIERAGLQLLVDTPHLPPDVAVFVDPDMWERIVLNLVSNALKFTFAGEIEVSTRLNGDRFELRVRDTGSGIPPDALPHLFERFHRVEGATARTREGSGIGLALVSELVRLHGGSVVVDSVLGHHSVFTVSLPTGATHLPADRVVAPRTLAPAVGARPFVEEAWRWLPEPAADAIRPIADSWPSAVSPHSNEDRQRVLWVDDNADMRAYVARLLGHRYDVEAVGDGLSALSAAAARLPDLVLSDVMLPGMDGFTLLQALRASPRTATVPVILLSARAGDEAKLEGLQSGADDYLVKPFSARELLARIEAHLSLARQRAEARSRLEAERARLHELFLHAPAAIALLEGPRHIFRLTNSAYQLLIGNRPVLDKPLAEALPELAGQAVMEQLDYVHRTGEAVVGNEVPVRVDRRGDGTLEDLFVNFAYAPLPGTDGSPAGIFVHAYEVTEQVRARRVVESLARDREQALAESQAAVRARDEFVSIASHELRTPVAAIRATAQLLRRQVRHHSLEPARADEFAARIETATGKLGRLLDDLLDVTRLSTGQFALRTSMVDVRELVVQIVEQAQSETQRHQVHLHMQATGCVVDADPDRVDQVLANLLGNAIKYSPDGGAIEVNLDDADDGVAIRVRDFGIGLPPGAQETIFQRFGRAANAQEQQLPGLGLGLYISRTLAERHGGRLWAESAGPGQGTTLTLWLPKRRG